MKDKTEVVRSYGLGKYEFTKLNYSYCRLQACLSPSISSCIWYFYAVCFYSDWSVLKELSLVYIRHLKN